MGPEKSNGALIGSVVIILILIVGGVYLWKTSVREKAVPEGGSDSAASIEANLNSMDMDNLDSGI